MISASCKDLHGDLEEFLATHGDNVRLVLLPMPLSRQCNPDLPYGIAEHEGACQLALLSLAAYRASPETFPQVHALLFENNTLAPQALVSQVERPIDPERLAAALNDPWNREMLQASASDFAILTKGSIKMPKLLLGGSTVMEGVARDRQTFMATIEHALDLGR